MADILARLVQKADSLSALQLTGALFTNNWGTLCQTHLPPPIHPYPPSLRPSPPHFLDRSAAPDTTPIWKKAVYVSPQTAIRMKSL